MEEEPSEHGLTHWGRMQKRVGSEGSLQWFCANKFRERDLYKTIYPCTHSPSRSAIHPSTHPSTFNLPVRLSTHPYILLSPYLSVHPSMHPYIHPPISLSVLPSMHPHFHLSICPFTYSFVCQPIHFPSCTFYCPPVCHSLIFHSAFISAL